MKPHNDRIETDDFVVVATQASATVLLLIRNKDRPDYRSAFLSPEQARKIAALLNSNADAADATLTPEARQALQHLLRSPQVRAELRGLLDSYDQPPHEDASEYALNRC